MPSIHLFCPEELLPGIRLHAPDLGLVLEENGLPLHAELRPGALEVSLSDEGACIAAAQPAGFFRGLALLCQHWEERPFHLTETPCFHPPCAMLDCSRNAVPNIEGLHTFLRRLSRMGYASVMLYTEDTYEVPGHPYFGYLRGRFTQDELRALDAYAAQLGIELIPCIQTLGHLARALHWPCMESLRDTADVLMVDEEETYAFIEEMIKAASAPFSSRRIHIGMDEAYGLGRGAHFDRYGFQPQTKLMQRHLARVREILQKLGLHGMMWSDMFFRMNAPVAAEAYPCTRVLGEDAIAAAPDDIDLVYWDYYSEDIEIPRAMLREHARFAAKTVFAGGSYTWMGLVPHFDKTRSTSLVTLKACQEAGIRDVIVTLWGDDASECPPLLGGLPGLQLYAEYAYTGTCDEEALSSRLKACTGCPLEPFLLVEALDSVGTRPRPGDVVIPVKQLLYEDPLLPLFEKDYEGLKLEAHYRELSESLSRCADKTPSLETFLLFYAQLAETLAVKCRLREALAPTVRSGSRDAVQALLPLCDLCIREMNHLADIWQTLWMQENRPFGFEVLDMRMGAQIQRLHSAKRRLAGFAAGEFDDLPELTCEKLPYIAREDGTHASLNNWASCVTPTFISFHL